MIAARTVAGVIAARTVAGVTAARTVAGVAAALALAACGVASLSACGGASAGHPQGNPPADPVSTAEGRALFDTGIRLAAEGDNVRAEQYLAASVARGVPEERVIGPLVNVCVRAQRLRQALGYAEPYLSRHPEVWQLRFLVASILLGLGQETRAREELVRVVHDAPDQPDPHFLLGTVARELDGDVPAARAELERYLALAPTGTHADEARNVLAGAPPAPPDHAAPAPTGTIHTIERVERPDPGPGPAGPQHGGAP